MKELFINHSFKVKLKGSWGANIDANLVTIYKLEDGIGALLISSYFLDSSVFNQISYVEELKDFVVNNLPGLKDFDSGSDIFSKEKGAHYTTLAGENFWFFEIKGGNDKVLLMSYNCTKPYSKKELDEVNQIIDSIEFV